MSSTKKSEYVQTFGKKKNATASAICRAGKGTIKLNGKPIDLVEPEIMRNKILEPILPPSWARNVWDRPPAVRDHTQ